MHQGEYFIDEIDLVKYKIFNNFEAKGLEQINLIGGYNNVGKTAFLEACYINLKAKNINALISATFSVEFMRQNINLLIKCTEQSGLGNKDLVNLLDKNSDFAIKTNIRSVSYDLDDKEGIKKYNFKIDANTKEISSSEIIIPDSKVTNVRFIDNFGLSDSELKNAYEGVQLLNKEDELNNYICMFDEKLESFKFIGDEPMCKIKGRNKYYSLTSLGDGLKSYIALICSLYSSSNGQLFIDEIDNGIHYTQFRNVWKIIFDLAEEVGCQIFAVTHSLEMIEAFNRVQGETDHKNSAYFELARDIKNDEIMMGKLDCEQLDYELGHNGKFRGE